MKSIPLTKGQVALVDDEDFAELSKFRWHAVKSDNTFYAVRYSGWDGENSSSISMHRQLLEARPDAFTDHKNGNGLDNQRHNIRACTHAQNCQAFRTKKGRDSSYRGVFYRRDVNTTKPWRARLWRSGKSVSLGYFENEEDAARAYDIKARELYGEFAQVNFK